MISEASCNFTDAATSHLPTCERLTDRGAQSTFDEAKYWVAERNHLGKLKKMLANAC